MASLVEIKGNDSLQFYDGNKSPSQKKVSLGTKRKRVAQNLKRKYEDAYALGEYDPWTGKKLNEPDRYLDVHEALKLFLKEKRQTGLAESSIGSYKGIVERSGVLNMPVDSVQKADLADFVYDAEVAKAPRHKRYRHLQAFFNWCEAEDYVQNPPEMEEPNLRAAPEGRPRGNGRGMTGYEGAFGNGMFSSARRCTTLGTKTTGTVCPRPGPPGPTRDRPGCPPTE